MVNDILFILMGFMLFSSLFRLWIKQEWGIRLSNLEKLYYVIGIISGILYAIFDVIIPQVNIGFQITIPSFISWFLLIVFGTSLMLMAIRYLGIDIKRIGGVQAYIFFPIGTPEKNKTLKYHKSNFPHRLIVNSKTKPPTAYYLSTDSYCWKLINKYSNLWVSESDPSPYDDNFTKKWIEQNGFILISRNAEKKDLLEEEVAYDPKYKDVQVKLFYPWWYRLPVLISLLKRGPYREPNKMLIINFKKKKCCPFPFKDRSLIRNRTISANNVVLRRKQHLTEWIDENELTFIDSLYWENELL